MFHTQVLPLVHVQSACSLAIAITLWTVLLPIAGLAVHLVIVNCHCGAVQTLPADHAQEAGLMKAPSIAQHLFSKVDRLVAATALVAPSKWHPEQCR